MKIKDLMDLTLGEILEKYCAVYNLECCYYYGITETDNVDEIFAEYNIEEEYSEAFNVENLINDELLLSCDDDILEYDKLVKIVDGLGITKKKNNGSKNDW